MVQPFFDVVAGHTGTAVVRPAHVRPITPNELAGANAGKRPDLIDFTYVVYELEGSPGSLWQSNGTALVPAQELGKLARDTGNVSPVFVINGTSTVVDSYGNVVSIGGGGGGGYPEAANYASLPGAPADGTTYIVLAAQGVPFVNRKDAGLYRYSGGSWVYLGSLPEGYFTDNVLTFFDNSDPTKQAKLELSGITSGATRTMTLPDKNGTLAMLDDIVPMDDITFDGFLQANSDYTTTKAAVVTAQGTANTALSNAATAQSTANTALTNAATAQGTANTALSNAATSQNDIDNHVADTGNPHSVTKTQVGLGNVLNVVQEPAITAGSNSQYWRGDKSWQTLDTSVVPESGNVYFTEARVRAALLTGYTTITAAVISATDSVLDAFRKLQAQITANLSTLTSHTSNTSNPHSVTKAQVGLGSVDNTADAAKAVLSATKLTGLTNTRVLYAASGETAQDADFTWDATNNVLTIGTLQATKANGVSVLESPGVSSVGLQFRTNSSNRYKVETPSASSDLAWYDAGSTEVMRLFAGSTGLGLGTASLGSAGSGTVTQLKVKGIATQGASSLMAESKGTITLTSLEMVALDAAAIVGWLASSNASLRWYSGTTQRMMLTAAGEFVVGHTTPLLTSIAGRGQISLNSTTDVYISLGIGGGLRSYLGHSAAQCELWNASNLPTVFGVNNVEAGRFAAAGDLIPSRGHADGSATVVAPATGASLTIGNNIWHYIVDPAGTIATLTLTMPSAPNQGQLLEICIGKTITTLTINANSGQTMNTAFSGTATAGQAALEFIYKGTAWYRV